MTTTQEPSTAPQGPAPNAPASPAAALPGIATDAPAERILERLRTASRRGRLAGFESRPASGALFAAAAHGHPFDSRILADHTPGVGLSFRLVLMRRMPVLFALILAVSVWPGVYCMDELIATLLPSLWRPWVTYYWYLPLAIFPTPWLWRSTMRRSRVSAQKHAVETIEKMAAELGGTLR